AASGLVAPCRGGTGDRRSGRARARGRPCARETCGPDGTRARTVEDDRRGRRGPGGNGRAVSFTRVRARSTPRRPRPRPERRFARSDAHGPFGRRVVGVPEHHRDRGERLNGKAPTRDGRAELHWDSEGTGVPILLIAGLALGASS